MSRRETPMTVWYWEQVGGTLIEEFVVVPKKKEQGIRLIDGIIILNREKARMPAGSRVSLEDNDVVVIQTKNRRLGMHLMGQAFYSRELVRRFCRPRSVTSVALCAKTDQILAPIFEESEGCKVVVCPPEICRLRDRSSRDA